MTDEQHPINESSSSCMASVPFSLGFRIAGVPRTGQHTRKGQNWDHITLVTRPFRSLANGQKFNKRDEVDDWPGVLANYRGQPMRRRRGKILGLVPGNAALMIQTQVIFTVAVTASVGSSPQRFFYV